MPESFATSLRGVKTFLKYGPLSLQRKCVILATKVPADEMLFNVVQLASRLSPADLSKQDEASFSIKEYLSQQEVVASSGSLLRAFKRKAVLLVGYSGPRSLITILPKPQPITADQSFTRT